MDYSKLKTFMSETDESRCGKYIENGWKLLAVSIGHHVDSEDGSLTPHPYFLLGSEFEAEPSTYIPQKHVVANKEDIPKNPKLG